MWPLFGIWSSAMALLVQVQAIRVEVVDLLCVATELLGYAYMLV